MSDVLSHPNAALKQTALKVDPATDDQLSTLAAKMAHAMYGSHGIGLAAPQLGVMKRVIVFDVDDGLVALCNPRLVHASEECEVDDEGCLSLPGITVPILRSCQVVCEAESLEGRTVRIDAEGLLARVLQHEIDHLEGVLIIDRASAEDRKEALRTYLEIQRGEVPELDGGM
jgi:peptide deformylase